MMKKFMKKGAILFAVAAMTLGGTSAVFADSSDEIASIQEFKDGTKAFMPLWKAEEDVRTILESDGMTPQEMREAIKKINDQYCEYTGGGQLDDIDMLLAMLTPMTYQEAVDKIRDIMESDGMTKQEQYSAIKKVGEAYSAANNGAQLDDFDELLALFAD